MRGALGLLWTMASASALACAGGSDPAAAPAEAAEVFALTCAHCHTSGLPGVPRASVPEDWNARDTNDFEVLVARAISGHRYMPPLGSCSWCNESQIRGVIALMVTGSEIVVPDMTEDVGE